MTFPAGWSIPSAPIDLFLTVVDDLCFDTYRGFFSSSFSTPLCRPLQPRADWPTGASFALDHSSFTPPSNYVNPKICFEFFFFRISVSIFVCIHWSLIFGCGHTTLSVCWFDHWSVCLPFSPLLNKSRSEKTSVLESLRAFVCGGGRWMWIGVGRSCPPVRNEIVTPCHLSKADFCLCQLWKYWAMTWRDQDSTSVIGGSPLFLDPV